LDYIDAHLDQEIKLANLAELIGMSQFHFSHLFKQSLGGFPLPILAATTGGASEAIVASD
jgi:AraC family transcriptional regulator